MIRTTIALLIAALATPALAQSTAGAPPRQEAPTEMISVTGTGRVELVPDRVRFTVGVDTMAPTPSEALEQNNEKVRRVIDALRRAGAKSEEIQTSTFSIHPQFEYLENRRPRIVGYQVTNSVTVRREGTADAGRLLHAAVDAGVNQASGLQFYVADETRAREEGLRKAYADARAKAQTLAAAAGRTLGRAVSITEGSAPMPIPPPMPFAARAMAMEARDASVPVEQGSEEMRFTVSVIFEMR
ncbi:MAG TPA: SIMPL domain-containing protein [Thermoanaerobaculia bacterium]|nr:SIMPL domain-containing protein [Thermoanaerobaculia bacterium]